MMKIPYIPALKRPAATLEEPFMKNDTVIGTIGKTQGVRSIANPHAIAWRMSPHTMPLSTGAFSAVSSSATSTTASSAIGMTAYAGSTETSKS